MHSELDLSADQGPDRLLRAQRLLLEEIVRAAPLADILTSLIKLMEQQSTEGMIGSIMLYDDATQTLVHGAAPGLPVAYNQAIDGISIGPSVGSCGTAAFRRETVIVGDIETSPLWLDFRDLAADHHLRACWSTPILSGGVLLGTFAMYYARPIEPSEDDLSMALMFARTAALAIERHHADGDRETLLREQSRLLGRQHELLAAEQVARETLEVTARRLKILATTASELAAADSTAAVGKAVVGEIAQALGASTAVLCCLDPAATKFTVEASIGIDETSLAAFTTFDLNEPLPAGDAVRTGEPVILRSEADRDARYPMLEGMPIRHPLYAVVPLELDGKPTGAIALGWLNTDALEDIEPELLLSVARQCAQALGRTHLLQTERKARERLEFLARASDVLSQSLDYTETLARVARLLVPVLADEASVHILDGPDLVMVEVAHVDPTLENLMREISKAEGGRTSEVRMHAVAATGRSLFAPKIEGVERPSSSEDIVQEGFQQLAPRSAMIVPLVARGEVLGIMTAVMSVSGREFTEDDFALVEDVSRRAGVALAHARSHWIVSETARTLQQSLLPASIPTFPPLDIGVTHHTAGDGTQPGGDVYDVWSMRPTTDGRPKIGALVADVSGKGVRAAALTALVRYTLRAAAMHAEAPSEALHRVNEAILSTGPTLLDDSAGYVEGRFATMVFLEITPSDDVVEVKMCVGGHPPVLLRAADGSVSAVGLPGTAVGLVDNPVFRDSTLILRPGDTLVAYTDGYTEARSPELEFCGDLLHEALAEAGWSSAHDLAKELEAKLLAFQGGKARDDMALLVISYPAVS